MVPFQITQISNPHLGSFDPPSDPNHAAAAPELSEELLGEAFLRLPPDDPACLLRASLVCKSWRRILADPAFRRRHREVHRTPSVVGFVRVEQGDAPYASRFVPNDPASGRPAARDLPGLYLLDCRHGRALFIAPSPSLGAVLSYDLVVWDPLTNEHRCLPRPSPPPTYEAARRFNAAVLCSATAEGCDHSKCHGGHFRVAFIWGRSTGSLPPHVWSVRVNSSETGNWSEPISTPNPHYIDMILHPSTLVRDTLYFRFGIKYAVEYQLGAQRLSIISMPPRPTSQFSAFSLTSQFWAISLMAMGDGRLGCMDVEQDESSLRLRLWSVEAASDNDGDVQWTRGEAIELQKLLPDGALPSPWPPSVAHSRLFVPLLGFAEGTDVIFVGTQGRNHPGVVLRIWSNSILGGPGRCLINAL